MVNPLKDVIHHSYLRESDMNASDEERASMPLPPPIYFIGCLVSGFLLEYIIPTRPDCGTWMPMAAFGGVLAAVSGLIALDAFRVMTKNRTPFDPGKPTTVIVREGVFRFSRNPLYLSLLLLLAGIGLMMSSAWLLAMVPVLLFLFHCFAVIPEERYLLQKFGTPYDDYLKSVRRWF